MTILEDAVSGSDFRLDLTQPLDDELRRIVTSQADRAIVPLECEGPSETVVHEARKATKRVRAVGQLIRPLIAKADWRVLDRAFRDAARLLAPLRDADVLRANAPDEAPERPDATRVGPEAVAAYRVARKVTEALDLHRATLEALVASIGISWRSARRAARSADPRDPETFHTWRKAVKTLGYQVQLVAHIDPPTLGSLAAQLDVLQEALGDHHDTLVAEERLGRGPELLAQRRDLEARTDLLGRWVLGPSRRRFAAWLAHVVVPPR